MTKRKEGQKENKDGRPTKYTEDIPAKMLEFFQSFEYTKETPDGKTTSGEYPTFEEFFVEHLGISTEQISDYKKYHEFSRAYSACQAIQKKFLIGHSLKGRYKENFATFILRANHKMYDRPDHEEVDLTKVSSTDLDILKEKIEIILAEKMQVLQNSVHVRQYGEQDYNFILNSYLKSYRIAESNRYMDNDLYYASYKKVLDKLLHRATCLIACNPEDEDQIFSWILYDDVDGIPVIHFVYTKYPYRKMKIAKTLLQVAGVKHTSLVCSHIPIFAHSVKDKIVFNPFLR